MNTESFLKVQKANLRSYYRQLRSTIGNEKRNMAEQAITQYILSTELFIHSVRICSFVSFGTEISTELLNSNILLHDKALLLPRISGLRRMDMIQVNGNTLFEENAFGIKEPIGIPCTLEAETPTLCIVPLLAFDDYGHRLGYGGGFYDVFLQEYPHVQTIGIAYSNQYSAKELPHDEHDMPMDMIITETGIHSIQKK